uniref:FHA domain-containing protein n=1 Tax=Ciona savignyi TaxID=51511 RepID=H2Y4M0_CIOSA
MHKNHRKGEQKKQKTQNLGEVKQVSVSKQRRRNSSSDSDSSSDSNSELSGNKNHKHPNDRAGRSIEKCRKENTENSRKKGKRSRSTSESGSSSSSDSSDDNEQLKRTKEKSHRHKKRQDDGYRDAHVDHRQRDERRRERRDPEARIKREEDFDRRQEENRRRRLQERRRNDDRRIEERERRDGAGEVEEAFKKEEEKVEKEKPNLGLSGALTADTNTFKGVVIKYNEPPEARVPKKRWRLYPFKGTENLKASLILHLHRQSAYLLGRLRRIADIPIDHPSCSKQHAVFQFRLVLFNTFTRLMDIVVDGVKKRRVKPYIIDLGSANGTYVNNERIEAQRYLELKEKDLLKFGFSSREYVLLHDKADTTEIGSDENEEEDEQD